MLAIIYLVLATFLGDLLARRVYPCVSLPHRFSVAFLVGQVFSAWITFLGSLAFAGSATPMAYGNAVFLMFAGAAYLVLNRLPAANPAGNPSRAPGSAAWDGITMVFFFLLSAWLMYQTLGYRGNELLIGLKVYGDFGPNLAIVQNFVWGHNFPPEYPFFAGPPMHYHFLFYFQAANLEYLGLNLANSLNVLSVLSLVAMLILVMVLGELLFASRAIGRIAGVLFFFHSTLAFIPFLRSQESPGAAARKILKLEDYIFSTFPYDNWGMWTLNVFINQRHIISAIGILLIVLIFLVDRYQTGQKPPPIVEGATNFRAKYDLSWSALAGFLFSGLLLGALVLWNGAVFIAAGVLIFGLLVAFPHRFHMLCLGAVTTVLALPQVIYFKSGNLTLDAFPKFHWGFVLDQPTVGKVLTYLGSTIGVKSVLIVLAILILPWFHRRLFIVFCGLLVLTFLVQVSPFALVNHKFINIWILLTNFFAAYALWRLWQIKRWRIAGRTSVIVLFVLITFGGFINLFPILNNPKYGYNIEQDPLIDWIHANTRPQDVFLTEKYTQSPILLAGRKIFLGLPVYAWSAGYPIDEREKIYKTMFDSREPDRLVKLLHRHNVAYVAINKGMRESKDYKYINETIYEEFFPRVFEDTGNRYAALVIYKVPSPEEWHPDPDLITTSP